MQCRFIVCLAFYTHQDDKAEIKANAESLRRKYGGRPLPGGSKQDFRLIEIAEGQEADAMARIKEGCKEIPREERNVGLYLLCHGGATEMHPKADKLATLVHLIVRDLGIGFRKISLAACRSAGQKLKTEAFQASPAHLFCKTLEGLLQQDERSRPLLDGVQAAAWQVCITTFDDASGYWKDGGWKSKKTTELKVGPGLQGIRSAVMSFPEPTLELSSTHPSMKTDSAKRALAEVKQVIGECWMAKRNEYGCSNYRTHQEAIDAKALKDVHLGMFVKQVNKRLGETKQVTAAMASYAKIKIVMRYDAKQNRWAIGSLADYTDNQDLSQLMRLTYFLSEDLRDGLAISFGEH